VVRGQLLLCQSQGAANRFLPGGHIEFRERAAVALKREIQEELGRQAHIRRFLGCCEHTFLQKGRWHAEINLVFRMALPGVRTDRPLASCEDWISFCWWPLEELKASALEPAPLRRLLPAWLAGSADFASSGNGWTV
jgi:8-oxo-dGTP pyrophosphatase MutT (NUDIX family)